MLHSGLATYGADIQPRLFRGRRSTWLSQAALERKKFQRSNINFPMHLMRATGGSYEDVDVAWEGKE